jgi:hypothetical protein
VRRHPPADDPAAEALQGHEDGVARVGRRGARREHDVRAARRRERPLHGRLVVSDVLDRHDLGAERLDFRPDGRLESLPSRRPDGLLDDDRDAHRPEPGHSHDRRRPSRNGLGGGHHGLGHQVRGNLDRPDEVALLDDGPVEGREDLDRVDRVQPLQGGDADVHHPVLGREEVDPALGRSTRPQPVAGHDPGEPKCRVVLVDVIGLGDEDRQGRPGGGASRGVEVGRRQPPALGPPLPAHHDVAGEDTADEGSGCASTQEEPSDAHPRD